MNITFQANRMLFSKVLNSEFGFRLDSSYMLSYITYNKLIEILRQSDIEIAKLSQFINVKRKKVDNITATILIKSLWKSSIHPLKIELRDYGNRSSCKELDIIGVVTGLGSIGKFSIVPKYLRKDIFVEYPLATTTDLVVMEPIISNSSDEKMPYYITALLNTNVGRIISNMLTYGSTGQLHLDSKWLNEVIIPIINDYSNIAKIMEEAIEVYEARAWRAYFKAMKIVNEYFDVKEFSITGTSYIKTLKDVGRMSAGIHLVLNAVSSGRNERMYVISALFDIVSGTAPSSREYKEQCRGVKYISTKSIDESGYIDEDEFYCYPSLLNTRNLARRGSLVLLKNAHSNEALGKVGIVYPYHNLLAISDLYILNPKNDNINLSFYVLALSKSAFFKYLIRSMAYGLTAHIKAEDLRRTPIPFIDSWSEVANHMRDFVENIHVANMLKKHAIAELEKSLLALIS